MDFLEYQARVNDASMYRLPGRDYRLFWAFALMVEAGEISNPIKKHVDGAPIDRKHLAEEIGDALWYLTALASEFGLDINQISQDNLIKAAGKVQALPPTQVHKETNKSYPPSPAPPLKYATVLKKLLPINRYPTGKGSFAFRTVDIKAAARYLGIKWEHAEKSWNATLDALDRYDPNWRGVDAVDSGVNTAGKV